MHSCQGCGGQLKLMDEYQEVVYKCVKCRTEYLEEELDILQEEDEPYYVDEETP